MTMHEASRTLVKSTPELWAECSDGEALRRHLGAFGEIRITKLEPETAVAWEGDDVRGTVTLEPSGWGTRVVLTAMADDARVTAPASPGAGAEVPAESPALVAPEPEPDRSGFFARLFGFMRRSLAAATPSPPAATEDRSQTEIAAPDTLGSGATPAPETEHDGPETAHAATAEVAETEDPISAPEVELLVGALQSLGAAHKRPFSRS